MKRTILGLLATLLLTGAVLGADGRALVEQQVAPGQARYIVVVERGAAQQASAAVTAMGGLVEADLGSRLVITMAPAVIDALRGMAGIRFIEKATLGSDDATPNRLEPLTLEPLTLERRWPAVEPNSGQTWTTGDYAYDGSGNIAGIGTAAAPGTQGYRTYTYDSVNRLTKAQISGVTPAATHEYGYDVYGNRTSYALNGQPVTVPPVSGTTNQLGDASYDSSGNQYSRGSTSATYDGFNMVTSYEFDGTNAEMFVYTANDERIGVLRGTEWEWSLRGPEGKVLRQYKSSSTNASAAWLWVEDFVYRDGMLLGSQRVAEEGGRRHYHLDHLGSARLVTSATGSIVSEHDFLPFGEERTSIGQHQAKGYDREEPLRFTGHERDFDNTTPNDSSSYIDYMHARYYATASGRFLSVDPAWESADVGSPQSWNRYSYVRNNPINLIDPSGMCGEGPEFIGPTERCGGTFYADIEVTAAGASDQEHYLWLESETTMNDASFAGDWSTLSHDPDYLWTMYQEKQEEIQRQAEGPAFYNGVVIMGPLRGTAPALTSMGASNLAEQLALEEAMGGAGARIMQGKIVDKAFPETTFAKMQHVHVLPNGEKIVIHYWENLVTGARTGFKFK